MDGSYLHDGNPGGDRTEPLDPNQEDQQGVHRHARPDPHAADPALLEVDRDDLVRADPEVEVPGPPHAHKHGDQHDERPKHHP
eukprot:scaffold113478_cov23-Prasinocladus_malaysianus.AAC.1